MIRATALLQLVLAVAFGVPNAGAADTNTGRQLHNANCISCHAALMQGDASRIYTRSERTVASYPELVEQVRRCQSNLSAGWTDAQINDVAAFLNASYYKF